jgi:hypothetical protein
VLTPDGAVYLTSLYARSLLRVSCRLVVAIIEFDAFARIIDQSETLLAAVTEAVAYAVVVVEGRDFFVRYDRATVNGESNRRCAIQPSPCPRFMVGPRRWNAPQLNRNGSFTRNGAGGSDRRLNPCDG